MNFTDEGQYNDGLLEVEIGYSLLHMSIGKLNRVAQEKGPMIIHFKEIEGKNLDTYFEIDGEYFKLRNPLRIEVSPSKLLKNVRILKKGT